MRAHALRADATLTLVALIWGSGFIAQKLGMDHMGPLAYTGLRYIIGVLMLLPFVLRARGRRRINRKTLVSGLLLGFCMVIAANAQQIGLVTTTVSRAGFITGLYVLIVPFIGLCVGHRFSFGHLAGAVLAAGGLYMLSGDISGGLRTGDLWVGLCALVWAFHVVIVAVAAPKADAIGLAFVQFAVVALITPILAFLFEEVSVQAVIEARWAVLYGGVFSIGLAFTLQIIGQRHAPPTHAAVIMSLESVFAAVFGVVLLAEKLSVPELIGCGLMFAGMLVSQAWPHKRTPAEKAELIDPVR
ncbi:MAG: DMT family transporter [Planctomycetota bacterium]|nr:MAG: DMT family transporter [Planctomycetota bacterium]